MGASSPAPPRVPSSAEQVGYQGNEAPPSAPPSAALGQCKRRLALRGRRVSTRTLGPGTRRDRQTAKEVRESVTIRGPGLARGSARCYGSSVSERERGEGRGVPILRPA
ncbi:hypothetical protein AOLI_G00077780 [Acnodon oligacanthus]